MGLPVVAPALPGNVELLGEDRDALVEPRDDAAAYADALAELVEDAGAAPRRRRAAMRERARGAASRCSAMADEHGALYDELIGRAAGRGRRPASALPLPRADPLPRPRRATERRSSRWWSPASTTAASCASASTPCGRRAYPAIEIDRRRRRLDRPRRRSRCSTSSSAADDVEVAPAGRERRAEPRPQRRRSSAAPGRYVLPVDADNVLLPDAVERLVEQLGEAPASTSASSTPTCSTSATARTTSRRPTYDLYALLQGNFCDTCSLFDRRPLRRRRALRREHPARPRGLGVRPAAGGAGRARRARPRADAALPQGGLQPLGLGRARGRRVPRGRAPIRLALYAARGRRSRRAGRRRSRSSRSSRSTRAARPAGALAGAPAGSRAVRTWS